MDDLVRRRLLVSGRVQGVFYRAGAEREAYRLRLAGSARNRRDGRVEIVVEGLREAVDEFVAWARLGPPRAEVTGVEQTDEPPTGAKGFRTE
jgi:acylphosphatase